jgi:hypothetical protein
MTDFKVDNEESVPGNGFPISRFQNLQWLNNGGRKGADMASVAQERT